MRNVLPILALLFLGTGCDLVGFSLGAMVDQDEEPDFAEKALAQPAAPPLSQPLAVTVETDGQVFTEYEERVKKELNHSNYDKWEALAQDALESTEYFGNGELRSTVLARWLENSMEWDKDGSFEGRLKEWGRRFPDSQLQQLARASWHMELGWKARGSGWARDVTEDGWRVFKEEHDKAEGILEELYAEGFRHPWLFSEWIAVGQANGYTKERIVELYLAGLELDPFYDRLHGNVIWFFQDRWHGQTGDVRKLFELVEKTTAARVGGAAAYAFAARYMMGGEIFANASEFDWAKLRAGYDEYIHLFPTATFNTSYLALAACALNQRAEACALMPQVEQQLGWAPYWTPELVEVWAAWACADGERPHDTPLHVNSIGGDLQAVERLLQEGAAIDALNENGQTALLQAIYHDQWPAAELLVERGASLKVKSGAWPLICLIADEKQPRLVRMMLERGEDPNTHVKGFSLLHNAADEGDVETLKVLLAQPGIEVNPPATEYENSPLACAAAENLLEAMRLLIDHGADLHGEGTPWPPLVNAIDQQQIEAVKLLLEAGADPNRAATNGWIALTAAVDKGNMELVNLLLEKGANVGYGDLDGWTALHMATLNGNKEMLAHLLTVEGASVNAATDSGRSLLHQAVKSDYPELVAFLVESGADITVKDKEGRTPLEYAREQDRDAIVAYLAGV